MGIKTIGDGEDLVLLHGWGMNRAVFEPWVEQLSKQCRCHMVNLPGFGGRNIAPKVSLDEWLDVILPELPVQAHWLGWSLGGLMVQRAAQRHPERLKSQLLVATTPHFPAKPIEGWTGIKSSVLGQFSKQLEKDARLTIERFLAIQAMGSDNPREDIKQVKRRVFDLPDAQHSALCGGLELLAETDFRTEVPHSTIPEFWLLGKQDGLVPVALAKWLEQQGANVTVMTGASHAPFISHPEEATSWLQHCLKISAQGFQF